MKRKKLEKIGRGAILYDSKNCRYVKLFDTWETDSVSTVKYNSKYYFVYNRNLHRVPFTEENLKAFGFEPDSYRKNYQTQGYVWNDWGKPYLFIEVYPETNKLIYVAGNMFPLGEEVFLNYIDELQAILKAMKCNYPRKLVTF